MRTNLTELRRRLLGTLLAAAALVAVGTAPAYAHYTDSIPAATPGGIGETMTFTALVPAPPYAPDPTALTGLHYHEYFPTPGCGGFYVKTVLHNVRAQPGYLSNAADETRFRARADTARTFGCVGPDGTFDRHSRITVRTTHQELDPVYASDQAGYLVDLLRGGSPDVGPEFYVNYEPVDFNCPTGQTKVQFGLKVTNLDIEIQDSPVYGSHSWLHRGPYYG